MIINQYRTLSLASIVLVARITVTAFNILPRVELKQDFIASTFHAPRGYTVRSSHQPIYNLAVNDDIYKHEECAIMEGTSPKVIKLRKQIQAVWNDPMNTSPIILHGPRGSGKGELADEIVYRLPPWQTRNVHRLSLDDGLNFIDTILGTASHPGLFDDLSDQVNTTLILKGFQSLHVDSKDEFDRRTDLVTALNMLVAGREFFSTFENKTKPFLPRIIGCTQRNPDYFTKGPDDKDINAIFIKVPSFESRAVDLKDIAKQKIKQMERNFGLKDVQLSKEATQRLLDHRWEVDCDAELDSELSVGLERLASEMKWNFFASNMLKSKHMLINAYDERTRIRLLDNVPFLRQILQSPWIFDHTLRYIVTPLFLAILLVLFLGPQSRDQNTALTIFWAGWWPGIMVAFPFVGRLWCSICPFMAIGNLAQEAVIKMGIELQKWPKWAEKIGSSFAFGLFFAILMWEELWDLPDNGALSACLLLLITAGAVVGSVIYEKRLWCRYMCPIGAMNKMFATLSMVEIRTWKTNCEGCTSPTCKVGGSSRLNPSDAFAIKGCTMDLKNNQLRDMGDCVLCMSCVKNCEREAPELNLRPIGQDYGLPWLLPKIIQKSGDTLAVSQVETNFWLGGIITILQGSVALHYMPKLLTTFGIDPSISTAPPALTPSFAFHTILAACILACPGTLSYIADAASVPLESLVNIWKRKLTPRPAENAAIVHLYESLMKEDASMQEIISEWDLDNDGIVSSWEMEEGFGTLHVPKHHHYLLRNILMQDADKGLAVSTLLDKLQELYTDITEADLLSPQSYQHIQAENMLETKLTFVEMFNRLDSNGNGYISKEEFVTMSDLGYFKNPLTKLELSDIFDRADIFQSGRLNLFEFMSTMRKTVRVEIQEIGYGYLPLAWGSLTAYWIGLGMQELGLSLLRLPGTFYVPITTAMKASIPQFAASSGAVHAAQSVVMLASLLGTISLTQKLCDDNKVGVVRFLTHATVQAVGTAVILYLMLSPEFPVASAY